MIIITRNKAIFLGCKGEYPLHFQGNCRHKGGPTRRRRPLRSMCRDASFTRNSFVIDYLTSTHAGCWLGLLFLFSHGSRNCLCFPFVDVDLSVNQIFRFLINTCNNDWPRLCLCLNDQINPKIMTCSKFKQRAFVSSCSTALTPSQSTLKTWNLLMSMPKA
jgi:hypothetical protein